MPTPTPTLVPLNLLITEVFPKPSQGEEWVEIYNPNAGAVALTGWELWDELSQPSLIFSFTTQTIGSNQWLVVSINKKLNDTGDGVTLKNPSGQINDAMSYTSSETDKSWARISFTAPAVWNLGATSAGASNPTPSPTPLPTPESTATLIPTANPSATTTPTLTKTPAPTLVPIQPATIPSTQSIASQIFLNPTPTTPVTPTKIPPTPTPTLIPTITLEKPTDSPPTANKSTKLPPLYLLGLTLLQLSSIGCNLQKQGMIKADAMAPIP